MRKHLPWFPQKCSLMEIRSLWWVPLLLVSTQSALTQSPRGTFVRFVLNPWVHWWDTFLSLSWNNSSNTYSGLSVVPLWRQVHSFSPSSHNYELQSCFRGTNQTSQESLKPLASIHLHSQENSQTAAGVSWQHSPNKRVVTFYWSMKITYQDKRH